MLRQDREWALGGKGAEGRGPMASFLLCRFLPKSSHPLPCFFFLSPSPTPRRGRYSGERRGSGPHLLSLMLSPVQPYSPLVSIGPIALHSTATSSTLVSKTSVSEPEGVGKPRGGLSTVSRFGSQILKQILFPIIFTQSSISALLDTKSVSPCLMAGGGQI